MTSPPADNPIRKAARQLAKQGFRPLPVKPGEKHPFVKWTKYRDSYSVLELVSEFDPNCGLWSMMGRRVGRVLIDTDNPEAIVLWRERLGDAFDKTARVRTRKGVHVYFTVDTAGLPIKSYTWESDPEAVARGAHYDFIADGKGVMLPPSRHAEDASFVYKWEVLFEAALPAPEHILTPPGHQQATDGTIIPLTSKRDKRKQAKNSRSLLAGLLLNPPEGEGDRNNWHAKVAGHYVKMHQFLDAYEAQAFACNALLGQPLDEDELMKVWRHRWEQQMEDQRAETGTAETGWLSGNGTELFTVVRIPVGTTDDDDRFVLAPGPWANADLIAEGVIDSEATGRTYATIVQRRDGLVRRDLITPGLLGSANDTHKWLAKHGVSVLIPKSEESGRSGHAGQRILRYLESQKPDAFRAVNFLGYQADLGFVTHEGVIGPDGMRPHEGVMPDPLLKDLAPYHYGMGPEIDARAVLREVLTFQDEQVCAVFGAWWVMTLLKGHVSDRIGHFPYFMIAAASEAGKSRGFFKLMRELAGSLKSGIGTRAAVRDQIGSHRNGIVHIDDPDDVENLAELLRAASGEATISKKGQDNRSTIETKMVAPILLSGESLGLGEEKAHRDRSITVEVPSPVGRMSAHDPTRPQIDDIKALELAHPDMTEYAGTYVAMALRIGVPQLDRLSELRGPAGRFNEIKGIVRLGARILAEMTAGDGYDNEWIVQTVDQWAAQQEDLGASNTVVGRVIPWALGDERWRGSASAINYPPVYVDSKNRIFINVERLAAEWRKECQRQGVRDRLSTDEALRAQLRAIGCEKPKHQWIDRERTKRKAYIAIPAIFCDAILGARPDDTDEPSGARPVVADEDDYGIPPAR